MDHPFSQGDYTIREAHWSTEREALLRVRHTVFTLEQNVDALEDEDGRDPESLHAVVLCGGEAVATGRVLPEGKIGRLCVLAAHRNRGVGTRLFSFLFERAKSLGTPRITLGAQLHAVRIYEKFGFHVTGEPFLDANIPHLKMIWDRPSEDLT
ncbi:GNAT family N-acetyltransferase [Myxococcota bacterium]|nr:GNAT family N-acetyltransferase [Myxococcota bacterium]MBU1412766.1 GNAT family N-acetyltransferase [Myxococcota bacterium]MBU1510183.1 GNAT family N-acetyltransferase [Myxococcota bacterium]PKN28042.1 MAG: GNAT family N-acetyltransferase [Deltaproteobacteria bacterium HGW-Deltaproteobacteria-22]